MASSLESIGLQMIPEEGPKSPVFSAIDPGDTLHVTIVFRAPLAAEALDRVERVTLRWFASTLAGARGHTSAPPELEEETLNPTCLHLAIMSVRDAQAIPSLVLALHHEGVPLAQLLLARVARDKRPDALLALMDPHARRPVRYDDEQAWWSACFDRDAAPPIAEDLAELHGGEDALIESERTTWAEWRGLPLHVRGLRICWGIGRGEFLEADGRALDVTRAFGAALDARFHGAVAWDRDASERPAPYNAQKERDGVLDRVRVRGRTGYSCVFAARELRAFLHGAVFRYREYELMLALRDTVRALDLEPVVCWRRLAQRYVVQLWEREEAQDAAA